MGNQQVLGLQACSAANSDLVERFMVDKDFRIDYRTVKQNMEFQPRQQLGSVQRQQIILLDTSQQQEPEEIVKMPQQKIGTQVLAESKNVQVKSKTVFEGLYGNVKLTDDGFVQYEDSRGMKYSEPFDPKRITKSFPSGISCGGLTKSVWFKDVAERDGCFAGMSNATKLENAEPAKLKFEGEGDNANYDVFNGIQGNQVVLYPVNRAEYTDIHGQRRCVSYNSSRIKKCFPSGICFGGLPSAMWLNDEFQRDKCFNCMKNQEQQEEDLHQKEEEKSFTGLYGVVALKADYEVEFTTLMGDKVICSYDPRRIRKVFPMGITSMSIPSTIWFSEMNDCESCYREMKKTY